MALARIEPQVGRGDFALLTSLVSTLTFVMSLLQAQRTTISRLRRLFGLSSSEKAAHVLDEKERVPPLSKEPGPEPTPPSEGTSSEPTGGTGSTPDPSAPTGTGPKKPKPKGHGRVPASQYQSATHIPVPHPTLQPGIRCPGCSSGTLFEMKEPAKLLRIIGQPILAARCWDGQRLRCSACAHIYTAPAPKEAQGPKFEETAVSLIALCRYGYGLPHNRIQGLQQNLQTPIPASTQWEMLRESVPLFVPVHREITRQAAQGVVFHLDDTYVRILSHQGKLRAELLKHGTLPMPQRSGIFTTGILSILDDQKPIALFRSGRKYAGENISDLLDLREAHREPPALMCDGLESRNVPTGHPVVEANCLAHARRGIVDQVNNFPTECTYILEQLAKVYQTDKQCKEQKCSAEERLQIHQRDSLPVMDALHKWFHEQLDTKQVEPHSGLGKAYRYFLKRWDKLTLFLRRPGVPVDNNACERALKRAICQRRNSLFYRNQRGADVGDLFQSLIYTAELHGENPFDFLTEVQRHAKAAAEKPADWLPWTYRATLKRLAEPEAGSRDPPPVPVAPHPPSPPALSLR